MTGSNGNTVCVDEGCEQPRLFGSVFCKEHVRPPTAEELARGGGKARATASPETKILCPHCHTRGNVTSTVVKAKRGVSGGKVTGAVLTGGLSILGTGLSRKQQVTEMHCGNCGTTWHVE